MSCANAARQDAAVKLRLNPDWGLPPNREWDLYRWYPEPARLVARGEAIRESAVVCLRPFQVVLLEAVPAGEKNALDRALPESPILSAFATSSIGRFLRCALFPASSLSRAQHWTFSKANGTPPSVLNASVSCRISPTAAFCVVWIGPMSSAACAV